MDENAVKDGQEKKRPYRKPELLKVPLRPEEAVLGACKTASTSGPAYTDCTSLSCSTNGS